MVNHRRSTSIPQMRLSQPLPPLPLADLPTQASNTSASTSTFQPPYRDVPEEDLRVEDPSPPSEQLQQPPGYEPMYDYLRSQQRPVIPPQHECPDNANSHVPYRDEPFVVTINTIESIDASQPPPSYSDLYQQHQDDMQRLVRQFDMDETPQEVSEDIMKWVVAMLLIFLTVACVGTAFNWGQPTCDWPGKGVWPGDC